jgi:hypothetical protein
VSRTYAKSVPATAVDLTQTSFFFDFIERVWSGGNPATLHRVCTLMRKMDAKWLIEEELKENPELLSEFDAVKIRCGQHTQCKAMRYSFLADLPSGDWRHPDARKRMLAYVILVTLTFPQPHFPANMNQRERTYIYEAVVTLPARHIKEAGEKVSKKPVTNYYHHCYNAFKTTIGTENDFVRFEIIGTYFAQQNAFTSVCAHACIQMAVNNSPVLTLKRRKKKLTSERINKMLGINHQTPEKRVGEFELDSVPTLIKGLTNEQLERVAKKLGIGILKADFIKEPGIDASKWIYPTLESCCPTILGIERPSFGDTPSVSHVVTVLGHTMNTDRWGPEAKSGYQQLTSSYYHSTSDWVDHFLIADDNFGMYRTLSTDELHHIIIPQFNANLHPSMAMSLIPKEIKGLPIQAEFAAFTYLRRLIEYINSSRPSLGQSQWFKKISESGDEMTCRTFWTTTGRYIEHLSKQEDSNGNRVDRNMLKKIERSLPALVWVVEVSLPDILWGNKSKLCDILMCIDFTIDNYKGIRGIIGAVRFSWMPGVAVIGRRKKLVSWPLNGYIGMQRPAYSSCSQNEW